MESDDPEGTPPRATPPHKSNLKSPVAKEVEKLRNNGLADKDILDKLIESDGFAINNAETIPKKSVNPNITPAPNNITNQASNFNSPPPVKRIAKPISDEKHQKMRKSSQGTNIENNNTEYTEDLNKTSNIQINRQIVILKNRTFKRNSKSKRKHTLVILFETPKRFFLKRF